MPQRNTDRGRPAGGKLDHAIEGALRRLVEERRWRPHVLAALLLALGAIYVAGVGNCVCGHVA
jgi:hypothetical protein